jgi:NAD+ kinase
MIESVRIFAKPKSRDAIRLAGELREWLQRRKVRVRLDETTRRALGLEEDSPLTSPADLVVVLGGDGTLLSVARELGPQSPLLGVNLGTLGFLTEVSRSELYPALLDVLSSPFEIEERALLLVRHEKKTGAISEFTVLNDAVINKSALARIIRLTLQIDGREVAVYRADGLIVSTPTGSTAYNLSAGGPIVHPSLRVAVITPICPHTLTLRPLVVPDSSLLEMTLETPHEEVFLTLDGQEGSALSFEDRVQVQVAPERVRLVRAGRRTFYDGLRSKLRWGE